MSSVVVESESVQMSSLESADPIEEEIGEHREDNMLRPSVTNDNTERVILGLEDLCIEDAEFSTPMESSGSIDSNATWFEIDKGALIEASLAFTQSPAFAGPNAKGEVSALECCWGLCQGISTDDLPEMKTACCGRFVHNLCYNDALDDNKPCCSYNSEQRAATQTLSTDIVKDSSCVLRFATHSELKPVVDSCHRPGWNTTQAPLVDQSDSSSEGASDLAISDTCETESYFPSPSATMSEEDKAVENVGSAEENMESAIEYLFTVFEESMAEFTNEKKAKMLEDIVTRSKVLMSTDKSVASTGSNDHLGTKITPHSVAEPKADPIRVSLPTAEEQCESCEGTKARLQTAINVLIDTIGPETDSVPSLSAHFDCKDCEVHRAKTRDALDALLM